MGVSPEPALASRWGRWSRVIKPSSNYTCKITTHMLCVVLVRLNKSLWVLRGAPASSGATSRNCAVPLTRRGYSMHAERTNMIGVVVDACNRASVLCWGHANVAGALPRRPVSQTSHFRTGFKQARNMGN